MEASHINIEQLCGVALSRQVIAMSQTEVMEKALVLEVSLDPFDPRKTISKYNLMVGDRGIIHSTSDVMTAIKEYNRY